MTHSLELDEMLVTVACRVKTMRTMGGMMPEDLADKAQIDLPIVREIEAARRNMTLTELYRLARAFDVWPSDLVADFPGDASQ